MSISTTTNRVEYQGNGTSAVFSFPYRFDSQSDLAAFVYNSSAATIAQLTKDAAGGFGFTVNATADSSGVYKNGGSVIFNSAPNVQTQVVIFRSSAITNNFQVLQNGSIPSTGLTNVIDTLTMVSQRVNDLITRSIRMPDGLVTRGFDTTLPLNINNAGSTTIMTNAEGTGLVLGPTLGDIQAVQSSAVAAAASAAASAASAVLANSAAVSATDQVVLATAQVALAGSAALSAANSAAAANSVFPQPFTQYAVAYASSTTEMAFIPSAAQGAMLTANGSSAPAFAFPLVSAKTAVYNATPADSVIVANSSNYTINLYGGMPVGSRIAIKKGVTSGSSVVTIAGSSATIDGVNSIDLVSNGDYLDLVAESASEWKIESDRISCYAHLHTTAGYGADSVASRVRRFAVFAQGGGNCFTVSNVGTTACTVTINLPGIYTFCYSDLFSAADVCGLVVNTGSSTTDVTSLDPNCVVATASSWAADQLGTCSWTGPLKAGDVVKPVTRGVSDSSVPARAHFTISRT